MMETLEIPNSVKEMLRDLKGKSLEDKFTTLILSDLDNRLRRCIERLYEFERKYGLSFREFKKAWETDKIPGKYSYKTESDYMEWESLDDEHGLLLVKIREIKGISDHDAVY